MDFTACKEERQSRICIAGEAKGSSLRKRQRKEEAVEVT